MNILSHRGLWKELSEQNSLFSFATSQREGFGTETDLRSFAGELYLSHDPIQSVVQKTKFDRLLALWFERPELPLFLNIKEDGLLPFLKPYKESLKQLRVVFFDMSVPQLVQFSKVFPREMLATRFSEYEREPSAQELCSWLWVDSFNSDPDLTTLKPFVIDKKMSIAIVSPDLHSRDPKPIWRGLKQDQNLPKESLFLCTDFPHEVSKEHL
ncbi:MAG: hypothetical protein ACKN9V_02960 [Pseudomonadota bacterium]